MLSVLIQNLIVAAIVVTAAILLAIRASKYFRPAKDGAGCAAGCGTCSNQSPVKTGIPKLLQLGEPPRRS